MSVGYKYIIFNLVILSQIEIPQAVTCEGSEDVSILLDKVPKRIQDYKGDEDDYQVSDTEFLFRMDFASYYVFCGRKVIVEIHQPVDLNLVRAYLLGTVMGAVLHQRRIVPLHGSAVVVGNDGIILTGESGSGKTSLCSAFIKNQYGFLSDDISAITFSDGKPFVLPSFPQQRISADTADALCYDVAKMPISEDKYLLYPHASFRKRPVQLKSVFEIVTANVDDVTVTRITGSEKLKRIIRNVYNPYMFLKIGIDAEQFMKCVKIADNVTYYVLKRPVGKITLNEQMHCVLGETAAVQGDEK